MLTASYIFWSIIYNNTMREGDLQKVSQHKSKCYSKAYVTLIITLIAAVAISVYIIYSNTMCPNYTQDPCPAYVECPKQASCPACVECPQFDPNTDCPNMGLLTEDYAKTSFHGLYEASSMDPYLMLDITHSRIYMVDRQTYEIINQIPATFTFTPINASYSTSSRVPWIMNVTIPTGTTLNLPSKRLYDTPFEDKNNDKLMFQYYVRGQAWCPAINYVLFKTSLLIASTFFLKNLNEKLEWPPIHA